MRIPSSPVRVLTQFTWNILVKTTLSVPATRFSRVLIYNVPLIHLGTFFQTMLNDPNIGHIVALMTVSQSE